jgi:hypothetical protein
MRMPEKTRIAASFTLAFVVSAGTMPAQSEPLSERETRLRRVPGRASESPSRLPELGWVLTLSVNSASDGRIAKQTKGARTCRRDRRIAGRVERRCCSCSTCSPRT